MSKQPSASIIHRWTAVAGNAQLWGGQDTYIDVPWDALPPLASASLDGTFGWLPEPSTGLDRMQYGNEEDEPSPNQIAAVLKRRVAETSSAGLRLPASFSSFVSNPTLLHRVPSCTSCRFELGERLVPIPGSSGPARLLRFMNDQQCCVIWYLMLEPDGSHRVASAAPEWFEEEQGESLEDLALPVDVAICATSFEEFIKRFWIENTLWYAVNQGSPPLTGELREYLDTAQKRAVRASAVVQQK